MKMNNWLEYTKPLFSGSTLLSWITMIALAGIIAFVIKFGFKAISPSLRKFAKKTSSIWDDFAVDLVDGLKTWVLYILIFSLLTQSFDLSARQKKFFLVFVVLASIFQIGLWGLHLIRTWRKTVLDPRVRKAPSSAAALGLFYSGVQAIFIIIIILIGLSNLGVDITALLAGLGVGGIAIALAAQNVLADLLASLSIVLDKPFIVGDFIVTGNEKGTVEHIGIKTTRLRSLSGEQIIISNKDLLEHRIQNFKRMSQRRVVQKFGVVYSTPAQLLQQIPEWIKNIFQGHEKLLLDRCHFFNYGDSSLDFEMVFFVLDSDYNLYMDLQQKVLLEIFNKFNEENVSFAFPTRTVLVENVAAQDDKSVP